MSALVRCRDGSAGARKWAMIHRVVPLLLAISLCAARAAVRRAELAGGQAGQIRSDCGGRRLDRHGTAPIVELPLGIHRCAGRRRRPARRRRQHCRRPRGAGGARRPYAFGHRFQPGGQSDAAAKSRLRLRARSRAGVDAGRVEIAARRLAVIPRQKHHRRHRFGGKSRNRSASRSRRSARPIILRRKCWRNSATST